MTDNTTVSAPLAVITPTDHSGLVIIAGIFGLFLVLIFMIVRVFARLYISPPFGRDDYALFVATVRPKTLLVQRYTLTMISGFRHHIFRTRLHRRRQRLWQSGEFDHSSKNYRATKGAVTRRVFRDLD